MNILFQEERNNPIKHLEDDQQDRENLQQILDDRDKRILEQGAQLDAETDKREQLERKMHTLLSENRK
jgi:hypothetical protein